MAFPPWGGGGVLRLTKLVKYLAALGWRITVLCSDELHPESVDETLLAEIPDSVSVIRLRGPFRRLGGTASMAASSGSRSDVLRVPIRWGKALVRSVMIPDRWIGWAFRAGRLRLAPFRDATAVLSSGPPHSAHFAGARLAHRLGVPLIADLRDDWAGNPLHANPAPWHGWLDRRAERSALRRAAAVVMVSEASRELLAARGVVPPEWIRSIPNGFDPADLEGLPPRRPVAPGQPVRLLFAGSLRATQVVGKFFEVLGTMARSDPSLLRMELVGLVSSHHQAVARAGLPEPWLTISDPVSHAESLRRMAASDVLVLFSGGGGGAGPTTMTGKIFEYLALRRPVLLIGPSGIAADLVRSTEAGVVAEPYQDDAIEGAVRAAIAHARDPDFEGASDEVLDPFSRRRQAETYASLIASVRSRSMRE